MARVCISRLKPENTDKGAAKIGVIVRAAADRLCRFAPQKIRRLEHRDGNERSRHALAGLVWHIEDQHPAGGAHDAHQRTFKAHASTATALGHAKAAPRRGACLAPSATLATLDFPREGRELQTRRDSEVLNAFSPPRRAALSRPSGNRSRKRHPSATPHRQGDR